MVDTRIYSWVRACVGACTFVLAIPCRAITTYVRSAMSDASPGSEKLSEKDSGSPSSSTDDIFYRPTLEDVIDADKAEAAKVKKAKETGGCLESHCQFAYI